MYSEISFSKQHFKSKHLTIERVRAFSLPQKNRQSGLKSITKYKTYHIPLGKLHINPILAKENYATMINSSDNSI